MHMSEPIGLASIEVDTGRTALPGQRDHIPVAPNHPSRQKIFYRLAHARVHHAAEAVKSTNRRAVSRTSCRLSGQRRERSSKRRSISSSRTRRCAGQGASW